MTVLAACDIEVGRRLQLTARVRHAGERRWGAVRKDDDTFTAPRAPTPRHHLAEPLRRTAGRFDSLQARGREECEGSSVRRPEGMKSVFGPRERDRRPAGQGAEPYE